MKKLLLFLIILFSFIDSQANIINVPAQFTTIQAAINASVNGDTVLVQPGTYMENIIFRGKKIVLTSRFYVNNDYSFITSTVINGSSPVTMDSASVVRIHNGEDSTTVLQGFTITGGRGTRWKDENGPGVYTEGGGILIALCHPTIQFNVIENNNCIDSLASISSTGGGGIRLGDGHPKILNNIIRNNKAMYGGGLVSNFSTFTMKNNVIYGNAEFQAAPTKPCYGGGGIWINGGGQSCIIENNTIVNNSASGTNGSAAGRGGGVILTTVAAQLRNNIVWGNTQRVGAQVTNVFGSGAYIIAYNDVEGGYTGPGTLTANINMQPLFDSTNYYLKTGSPCVDAGDSSLVYFDPADSINPLLAKFPSRGLRRNDMGAYGGPGSRIIATSIVGVIGTEINLPEGFRLAQNYPNPFNPETIINYQLSMYNYVSLSIYDINGRLIETLVNGKQSPGIYSYKFDGSKLSSGIYFYKLETESFSQTKKMLLIK